MKKFLIMVMCMCLLTGCTESVGIIGGADGPANIVVKGKFGEQFEKRPIRMINIDGVLYFDSGLASNLSPRCGTLDRRLEKVCEENEIPKNNGEANFQAEGCQNATDITKEVNIGGKWVIFKKFQSLFGEDVGLEKFKYCFYIKGKLNNAAKESELVVITDNENITFSDIYEPMLQSKFEPGKPEYICIYDYFDTGDKWGISLTAENVTNTGMTLEIEQFGGNPSGDLQTGSWFQIEKNVDGEWKKVDTNPLIDYAWTMEVYKINKNDVTEMQVEWKWLYGELPPGDYRLSKEIMDFRKSGDYDKEIYTVQFILE